MKTEEDDLASTAASGPELTDTDTPLWGPMVAFVPLFLVGMLLLGASVLPPSRVPWPVISQPLYLHRSDLAAIGIGTIALALLCLNIIVLI